MAITKQAREQLGATIIGHDNISGVRTASGLIKTSRGLIAPASTSREDTRSGALDLPDEEETIEAEEVTTPEEPVKAKLPATGVKRQRTKKSVVAPTYVRTEVTIVGSFTIPTQYTHVYVGNGVLVLGMTDLSFKPTQAEQDDDGTLAPVISLDKAPGRQYIYCGNSFTDAAGIVNLLLIEIQGE